jgi:site-specific DNA recombinase
MPLPTQVRELRVLARRHGWKVAAVIAEENVPIWRGEDGQRQRAGRWQEVETALREGTYDGLVVRDLDRIFRSPEESIGLARLKDSVGFGYLEQFGGHLDRMTAMFRGWAAEQESEKKSQRLKRKWAEKAADGYYQPGRYRPFGYQLVKNDAGVTVNLAIDPFEAEIVREIAGRIVAGESLHMIALDMERRGVPTVSGAQWHRTTVKRVVKPACAGLREHRGAVLSGNWPAIIDRETYLAAQAAMQYEPTPPKGHNTRKHLLSGFLVCGICGVPLYCNGTRYQCTTRSTKNGIRGCGKIGRKRDYLDGLITDLVVTHLERLNLEAEQVVTDEWTPVIEAAKAELAFIHTVYEAGDIPAGDWVKGVKAAHKKLSEAEAGKSAALAGATGQATRQAAGEAAREKWDALNLSQKRAILSELFEAVIVNRAGRGNGLKYRDDLVVPVWRNS